MRWDERQVAMLREMGIRLWWPEGTPTTAAPPRPADPVVAAPASAGSVGVVVEPRRPGGGSAAAPLAALDWTTLRATAADCTACALCAGRTRSVFGGSGARADWLVVGEPPVDAEDREGEPFVGRAGQLLDNMLRAVGVRRGAELAVPAQRACVSVPVKCRPPAGRAPTLDEFATCETYLARQIELVEPRIVIAMGSAASLLLRTDEPLGRLRGRVHRYRGLPLVATYPPTYLLRHPTDKARAWEDLCLAVETLQAATPVA